METLGKESLSNSTVKKWAAEFKRWRESVEDDGRSVHPKDATTMPPCYEDDTGNFIQRVVTRDET